MTADLNKLAQRLAAAKFATDMVRDTERSTKAELADHLAPGDRKMAVTDDGAEIATITRAKVTETTELAVTDEAALIAWIKRQPNWDGIRTIETVEDWKVADLLARAEKTGELPDGVEPITRTTGGHISVRQSSEQKAALLQHRDLIAAILTDRKEIDQ